jgi:putative tricarboxylic transport membrane protein
MLRSDRIFGLVMIVVALGYILSAFQIQTSFMADPVGAKTFPIAVALVAILCSIIMILRPDEEPDWPEVRTLLSLALAVVVMVGYAYALKPLGFLIPTALAAGILSWQISERPGFALFTGIGLSGGLYIIFKFIFGLSLQAVPKAWLG